MSDDKNKQDNRDRSRVAGDEDYEVQYFAERHGISQEQAQQLIDRHGNNREELDRAAEQMRG